MGSGRRGTVLSRRLFVRRALGTAAGWWLTALPACDDTVGTRSGETRRDAGQRDAAARPDAGLGDGDAGPLDGDDCEPFLTPLSTFFVQYGGQGTVPDWQQPDLDTDTHRLQVEGEVATPLSLSLADLEAMAPQLTVLKTMQCVFRLHGTALYHGVPLRAVLDAAGIDRSVTRRILFHGQDGFRNNLRLEDVYSSDDAAPQPRFEPMLALSIDGQPLPRELGRPVRLLLSDRFGFKNVKWLARIEATRSDEPVGDYQQLGLASDEATIQPNTWYGGEYRMPASAAGHIMLCGYALSGFAGIASVEVAIDDGAFQAARIVPLDELVAADPGLRQALQVDQGWAYPFVGVKAPWELELDVSPGEHMLVLRVTDLGGEVVDGFRARLSFAA